MTDCYRNRMFCIFKLLPLLALMSVVTAPCVWGAVTAPIVKSGVVVEAALFGSFIDAVAAAKDKTLVISSPQKLTTNFTIPENVSVVVLKGGTIKKESDAKLTIGGPFSAGLYAIFENFRPGEVVFAAGSVGQVVPQWWGAKGNGNNDDTAAIRMAFASHNHLHFPSGTYIVDGSDGSLTAVLLAITRHHVEISGDGSSTTFLWAKKASSHFSYIKGNGGAWEDIDIKGIHFVGDYGNRPQQVSSYFVWLNNMKYVTVTDCKFSSNPGYQGAGAAIIVSNGSQFCSLRGNVFNSNASEDINFYGADGSIYNNEAIGNMHYHSLTIPYEIEGRRGETIAGHEVFNTIISDNVIASDPAASYQNSGDAGVNIIGARGVIISGNAISRRGTSAIRVIGSQDVTITGNRVNDIYGTNPEGKGIELSSNIFGPQGKNRSIIISGNSIKRCRIGLSIHKNEIQGGSEAVAVIGNTFADVDTGIDAQSIASYEAFGNIFTGTKRDRLYSSSTASALAK